MDKWFLKERELFLSLLKESRDALNKADSNFGDYHPLHNDIRPLLLKIEVILNDYEFLKQYESNSTKTNKLDQKTFWIQKEET